MTRCRILLLLLSVLLPLLALLPLPLSPTADPAETEQWMAALPDDTPLTALTIPGTHDTGALYSIADIAGKCQTLSVTDQLAVGVRFLDIRLQAVGDTLRVVHDFVDQKTDFASILSDITAFLSEHPTEFLLMSVKQDAAPKGTAVPFAELLETALQTRCGTLLDPSDTLPETLGAARGKLFILSRYDGASLGLPCADGWEDNAAFTLGGLYVQDRYAIANADEKIGAIADALTLAADSPHALVLNYTSCYYTSGIPPLYAGRPAHDIHPWLTDVLQAHSGAAGVVICDFMTAALARTILEVNFQ